MTSQVIAHRRIEATVGASRPTEGAATTSTTTTHPTTNAASGTHTGTGDGGVLLADALSVNATLSGLVGLVSALGAIWLDDLLGVSAGILAHVGVGLVVFAVGIIAALARPSGLRRDARIVIAADIAWVVGAVVVIAADVLAPAGDVLLAVTTVAVAGFVVAQAIGLRRVGDAQALGARPISMTATRDVVVPVDQAWALVSDAGGYADFAPGLANVTTSGEVADGMARTCTIDGGRQWCETCTVIEPDRSYRMEVDTDTYPLRYRLVLHEFGMTWRLSPTDTGTRLRLTFAGTTKLGILGRLAMAASTADDPVTQIIESYATTASRLAGPDPTG